MSTIRRGNIIRRNDRCICGSGKKFKHCCSPDAFLRRSTEKFVAPAGTPVYIDSGEEPIRWVIVDRKGTAMFSDKAGRVLVFAEKAAAETVARLDEFSAQEPGEINLGGVGPTKWAKLQEMLPFVEVQNAEEGAELIRERISIMRAKAEETETTIEGELPQ